MRHAGDFSLGSLTLMVAVFMLFLAIPSFAAGPRESMIYQFPNSTVDGCGPMSALIADSAGNLYGTGLCGSMGEGVVFELVRPVAPATQWVEQVLYNFTGGSDGSDPYAPLTFDSSGNLYGTAGTVVFRLTPPATAGEPWTESVLHTFQGGTTDGDTPDYDGVVFDAAGNLYGATTNGGITLENYIPCQQGCGVVYELSPPATEGAGWTETVIHYFNGGEGANPSGTPTLDSNGNLYGVTSAGGRHGDGVFYRLLKPTSKHADWIYRVFYAFGATATDSINPQSSLTFHGRGILYGTAQFGGAGGDGTAFQLVPPSMPNGPWTENVLHAFDGGSDGAQPVGNVIFDGAGNIYGTTTLGGGNGTEDCGVGGCGTVYELTPPTSGSSWSETLLHSFPASTDDGEVPLGGLLLRDGVLFGTTSNSGPAAESRGGVFELMP
jgi:hypothetical protein